MTDGLQEFGSTLTKARNSCGYNWQDAEKVSKNYLEAAQATQLELDDLEKTVQAMTQKLQTCEDVETKERYLAAINFKTQWQRPAIAARLSQYKDQANYWHGEAQRLKEGRPKPAPKNDGAFIVVNTF